MSKPLVSIIVPVYNAERYLEDCIESLIGQTYRDIEIILVDDGSTDGSKKICERYAVSDSRIKLIHKRNDGAGSARNTGLAASKGEYIYFCDSDDTIRPETIERSVDAAVSEDADLVMFGAETVTGSGDRITNDPYEKKHDYSSIRDPKALFAEMKKNDEYACCVPFLFMRRTVIRSGFIRTIHEDELFTPQIIYSARRAVVLPDIFYIRKLHENSVTTTKKCEKNYTAMLHVIAGLEKIENKDATLVSHICDLYRTINVMYSGFDEAEKEKVKEKKKKADKYFIKMMIGSKAEYRKFYRHAVLSKIYHAGKY